MKFLRFMIDHYYVENVLATIFFIGIVCPRRTGGGVKGEDNVIMSEVRKRNKEVVPKDRKYGRFLIYCLLASFISQ